MFHSYKKKSEQKLIENQEHIQSLENRLALLENKFQESEQAREDQERLIRNLRTEDEVKTSIIKQQEEHQNIFGLEMENHRQNLEEKNKKIKNLELMIAHQFSRESHLLQHTKYLESVIEKLRTSQQDHDKKESLENSQPAIQETYRMERNQKKKKMHSSLNKQVLKKTNNPDSKDQFNPSFSNVVSNGGMKKFELPETPGKMLNKVSQSATNISTKIVSKQMDKTSIAKTNAKLTCETLVEEAISLRNTVSCNPCKYVKCGHSKVSQLKTDSSAASNSLDIDWIEIDLRLESMCTEVTAIRKCFVEKEVESQQAVGK
ncbi:hypothetical protein WDU94_011335 [Cyamophila willieti]